MDGERMQIVAETPVGKIEDLPPVRRGRALKARDLLSERQGRLGAADPPQRLDPRRLQQEPGADRDAAP
jgi:hypothetical protein